jgi:hypothetical protein
MAEFVEARDRLAMHMRAARARKEEAELHPAEHHQLQPHVKVPKVAIAPPLPKERHRSKTWAEHSKLKRHAQDQADQTFERAREAGHSRERSREIADAVQKAFAPLPPRTFELDKPKHDDRLLVPSMQADEPRGPDAPSSQVRGLNLGDEVSWADNQGERRRGMVIGHHDASNLHVWEPEDENRPHKLISHGRVLRVHSEAQYTEPNDLADDLKASWDDAREQLEDDKGTKRETRSRILNQRVSRAYRDQRDAVRDARSKKTGIAPVVSPYTPPGTFNGGAKQRSRYGKVNHSEEFSPETADDWEWFHNEIVKQSLAGSSSPEIAREMQRQGVDVDAADVLGEIHELQSHGRLPKRTRAKAERPRTTQMYPTNAIGIRRAEDPGDPSGADFYGPGVELSPEEQELVRKRAAEGLKRLRGGFSEAMTEAHRRRAPLATRGPDYLKPDDGRPVSNRRNGKTRDMPFTALDELFGGHTDHSDAERLHNAIAHHRRSRDRAVATAKDYHAVGNHPAGVKAARLARRHHHRLTQLRELYRRHHLMSEGALDYINRVGIGDRLAGGIVERVDGAHAIVRDPVTWKTHRIRVGQLESA